MKRFTSLIILFVSIFTLAACGESGDNTLVVGLECNYAPYNWTTPTETETSESISGSNQYCDGYDVKVARALADDLGMTLVIKKIDWDGLIPALTTNQIDVIIAGMSPTEERKQTISFSNEYYRSEQVVVVREDSTYASATSINDFVGATLTAQLGTLQEGLVDQMTGAIKGTSLGDYPTLVTAVISGTADGFVAELPVAQQMIANNSDLTIVQFSGDNGFVLDDADVTCGIGVRKGDTDLLNKLNESLAKISNETRNEWMTDFVTASSN